MADEKTAKTVGHYIDNPDKRTYISFSEPELKQLVEKKDSGITRDSRSTDIKLKVCELLGIKAVKVVRTGALKQVTEKTGLKPAEIAKKLMDNPKLLEQLEKA